MPEKEINDKIGDNLQKKQKKKCSGACGIFKDNDDKTITKENFRTPEKETNYDKEPNDDKDLNDNKDPNDDSEIPCDKRCQLEKHETVGKVVCEPRDDQIILCRDDIKYPCNRLCRKCPACRKEKLKKIQSSNKVKKELQKPKIEKKKSESKLTFFDCGYCQGQKLAVPKVCINRKQNFCSNKSCNIAKVYELENKDKEKDTIDEAFTTRCCYKTVEIDSKIIPIDVEDCPIGKCGNSVVVQVGVPTSICRGDSYCANTTEQTVQCIDRRKTRISCSRKECVEECTCAVGRESKKIKLLKKLYDPGNKKTKYLYSDKPICGTRPEQILEKLRGDKKSVLFKYKIKGVCPKCQGLNMTDRKCYYDKDDSKSFGKKITEGLLHFII